MLICCITLLVLAIHLRRVKKRRCRSPGYFRFSSLQLLCPWLSVCAWNRTSLRSCVTFGRARRISMELTLTAAHRSWTPAFSCSTFTLCSHTYVHTRLIGQIDLHMSDGANFSSFPLLVNLWPLIYTELNLYILIMVFDSLLFTCTYTLRSFVWLTMRHSDTCCCCLSTSNGKKVQEHAEGLRKCVKLN